MSRLLIVGGSKGIGNALLKQTVNDHEVINISRTIPDLTGSEYEHYELDVLKDELPDLERLDQLVYCPGSISLKPISSLKLDQFKSDFEVNVLGAVKVIKKYLKQLKKSEKASIVLFSTVAVQQGMPFHASIAVAKAGIEALMKSLAAELAPKIRVNCIAPSVTDTPLASGLLRNEKAIENIKNRHPLKDILYPEDVAAMVKFLLSDHAKGITGQIIGIDSGLSTLKL